ncbi:MAG: twin-arginine translocase TatA/TatE family subunit [Candidatus Woesearchaeota archaeon]
MAIGMTEIILVLIVILILFGPKRLPELAKSIGSAVKEYRKSVNSPDRHKDLKG